MDLWYRWISIRGCLGPSSAKELLQCQKRSVIGLSGCAQDTEQSDGAEAQQASSKPEFDAQGDSTSQQSQAR